MAHFIPGFSYSPLTSRESGPVEAPDVAPERRPDETDVWLTEWQVAEEGLDLKVGDHVAWALVPMDEMWALHLFGYRRPIPLQLDTYGDATREDSDPEWTHLAGQVTRIDQVSTSTLDSTRTRPEHRAGVGAEHEVPSLRARREHYGELVGWVARVRH